MATDQPQSGETPPIAQDPSAQEGQEQQQVQIVLDDTNAHVAYANAAAVRQTDEVVVIDFALNLNPTPPPGGRQTIRVSQRLIVNYNTAHRLAALLQHAVQRQQEAMRQRQAQAQAQAQAEAFIPPGGGSGEQS